MTSRVHDIIIIGGGINGCGLAREAARRGVDVALFERGDLGGATSSASSKLIHGGLRYLETGDFRLVREALAEREILWRMAPHLIQPLRFILPVGPGGRPAWMLRIGLWLYDRLGGGRTWPASGWLELDHHPARQTLRPEIARALSYCDGWVDDSRLVIANAVDAARHGASIHPRMAVVAAHRHQGLWRVETSDGATHHAHALVNAGGPWAGVVGGMVANVKPPKVRLVGGSHIVTRRLFNHDEAYILQNDDRRVVFALPFQGDFTLIGATDRDVTGEIDRAAADDADVVYLCRAVGRHFARAITPGDVVWRFHGVRPLADVGAGEARAASRDHKVLVDVAPGAAPLVTLIGGKITVYRRVAGEILAQLAPFIPALAASVDQAAAVASLPGGDFPPEDLTDLIKAHAGRWPFLSPATITRLTLAHGTETAAVMGDARAADDMGADFGHGFSAREAAWLMEHEWARGVDDLLWRRTKLGLRLSPVQVRALARFLG